MERFLDQRRQQISISLIHSLLSLIMCSIGPPGTAICAYRADNSLNTGGTGFNRGIFDIFREDLTVVMPDGTTAERENTFVEVHSSQQCVVSALLLVLCIYYSAVLVVGQWTLIMS